MLLLSVIDLRREFLPMTSGSLSEIMPLFSPYTRSLSHHDDARRERLLFLCATSTVIDEGVRDQVGVYRLLAAERTNERHAILTIDRASEIDFHSAD